MAEGRVLSDDNFSVCSLQDESVRTASAVLKFSNTTDNTEFISSLPSFYVPSGSVSSLVSLTFVPTCVYVLHF